MKLIPIKILLLICFLLTGNLELLASTVTHNPIQVLKPVKVDYSGDNNLNEQFRSLVNSGSEYTWNPVSTEIGLTGASHTRYQQFYKEVKIKDAMLVLHLDLPGKAFVTGTYSKLVEIDDRSEMLFENLLQLPEIHNVLNDSQKNSVNPELCWVWCDESQKFIKTYLVEFHPYQNLEKHILLINAISGNIISNNNHNCFINTPGVAQTGYHGVCGITTYHQQGSFSLKSTNRGQGIETRNLNNQLNYFSVTEFNDADNYWDQQVPENEKYATDAHFCAEQYYDFLLNDFGRNSIDNNGYKLISYLNYGNGLLNAFWNGSAVVYGGGNQTSGPLITLDVGGHEFTHGLIQKTANLNYHGEPGTINEALADIFGTALEFYVFPQQADWQVGELTGQVLRSLQNPKLYNQPDTYHGINWYYGAGDNGGIHINSGFINKWFYLLSEGGQGINDKGWNFTVAGIGFDKASRIAYQTLVAYLLPASGFDDLMYYTIQSASDLYGTCSPEYMAVVNAWKAVGLRDVLTEPLLFESYGVNGICLGDSVNLTATGLPGSIITWFRNDSVVQTGILSNYLAFEAGTYRVSETRCGVDYVSDSITLEMFALPVVSASSHQLCEGEVAHLSGFPGGGYFSVSNPYNGPSTSYQYSFTDSNGCSSSAIGTVFILEEPVVKIENENHNFPLNANPVKLIGNVPGHFHGVGVVDEYFIPEVAGIGGPYTVYLEFTNVNGCVAKDSVLFLVEKPCKRDVGMLEILTQEYVVNGITATKCSILVSNDDFEIQWRVYGAHKFLGGITDPVAIIAQQEIKVLVEVTLVNTCKENTIINKILKSETFTEQKVKVYPNPSSGLIHIEFNNTNREEPVIIELVDAKGRIFRTSIYNKQQNATWNIEELPVGSYLLKITQGSIQELTKLVVN